MITWLLLASMLLLAAPGQAAFPDGAAASAATASAARTGQPLPSTAVEDVDSDPCAGAPEAPYADRDQAQAAHLAGIDCATWRRIVQGFTVDDRLVYRPRVPVTRGQLAGFLVRTLIAAGYERRLDDGGGTAEFRDIAGHPDERAVNQLARAGIITGDPGGRYQPNAALHREELATSLVRAYEWALDVDLTATGSHFTDVPVSSGHADDINAGYEHALLTGTGAERFSPRRPVARDEMASFSVNLLRGVWVDDGLGALAARIRGIIAYVEASGLPCETRNQLVGRLRLLHDAIESGRRSAARGLLIAWMLDARTSVGTGLLSPEHGATVHAGLNAVLTPIGEGWPEHARPTPLWRPVPSCDAGVGGTTATSGYNPEIADFDADDALLVMQGLVGMVPIVGPMLASITALLWPSSGTDVSALIDSKIEDSMKQTLVDKLKGLSSNVSSFLSTVDSWKRDCAELGKDWSPPSTWQDPSTWGVKSDANWCYTGAYSTWAKWDGVREFFNNNRPPFQSSSPTDYRVTLLPLYTQFETLYLTFLREGMLLEPYWQAAGGVSPTERARPRDEFDKQLDPDYIPPPAEDKVGISYVDAVFELGLPPAADSDKTWNTRNAYVRDMTAYVLDFRDTWRYLDPVAYPDGAPDIKHTRMIYSDLVGGVVHWSDFQEPANVPGPLTELTVWTEHFNNDWSGLGVEAVQATSPPTTGPARAGRITGDTKLDHRSDQPGPSIGFYDLRDRGPITAVETTISYGPSIFYPDPFPASVTLTFATGATETIGYESHEPARFNFPGYVLATAEAVATWAHLGGYGETVADSMVFGFRRADSFSPSGSAISAQSGKCLDVGSLADGTQPRIWTCNAGSTQVWTYDIGRKALSVHDVNADMLDPTRPQDKCLTATGTAPGAAAVIGECTYGDDQRWDLVPGVDGQHGLVKAEGSGLVLDVAAGGTADGTPVRLSTDVGGPNQLWSLPSPLLTQLRSVGTGRCLEASQGVTPGPLGAPVWSWTCDPPGSADVNQLWTYDDMSKALTVYSGQDRKCLQGTGTAGDVTFLWYCTGDVSQQWTIGADRTITSVQSGLALEVRQGQTADSTPVIQSVKHGETPQQWSRPAEQGRAVYALGAGKCLDLDPGSWADGTQAVIEDCASKPSQRWTYHPLLQRLTVYGGAAMGGVPKCLGTDATGTKAVIGDCGSNSTQRWVFVRRGEQLEGFTDEAHRRADETIRNVGSGLCLGLPGTGVVTARLTKVELQTCRFATDTVKVNQQWIGGFLG